MMRIALLQHSIPDHRGTSMLTSLRRVAYLRMQDLAAACSMTQSRYVVWANLGRVGETDWLDA